MTAPHEPSASAPPKTEAKAVRSRALSGGLLEIAGYGGGQVLRLVSTIILSRLLFPEAYGLASLVQVFVYGVYMLSDVGFRDCVMRSKRGGDQEFLDTVWTLHVIRGVGLAVVITAIAWPVSLIFREPLMLPMLAFSGLSQILGALTSTSMYVMDREMRRGPSVAQELIGKIVSLAVMYWWASQWPSAWALLMGAMADHLTRLVFSWCIKVGRHPRFRWDKTAVAELNQFGRWILVSSALTFLCREGDRLLLGRLAGMEIVGLYGMAATLSGSVSMLASRLNSSVFYGILGAAARDDAESHRLPELYYRARLRFDLLLQPAIGLLAVIAPLVVATLYDDRYSDSGWMLRVLCLRTAIGIWSAPPGSLLLARGIPRALAVSQAAALVTIWVGLPVAYSLFGVQGALWAAVFSEVPQFIVMNAYVVRQGMFRWKRELIAPAGCAVGALVGLVLYSPLGAFLRFAYHVARVVVGKE